jgi:hypothetical protein
MISTVAASLTSYGIVTARQIVGSALKRSAASRVTPLANKRTYGVLTGGAR